MEETKGSGRFLKKAMALCAGSEKCRHDINARLVMWGVGEAEREKIIERLVGERFIDEERYAVAFTLDRFRQNRWGRIKIASMLRLKGLHERTIRTGLDSIEGDVYLAALKKMVASQRKQVKAKNEYELRGKLIRFAVSRGFETDLVYEVVGEFINDGGISFSE